MSRGPGCLQRGLLAALEEYPALLLPPPYSRAQYVALYRASRSLAQKGLVCIWHTGLAGGTNCTWVTRPGYQCQRSEVPRLCVDTRYSEPRINTYQMEAP
jgi:hypothetical protein